MDFSEDFTVINPGCGCARFAVPTETHDRWRRTHEGWHCPHCGKGRVYKGPSVEQKRLADLERQCSQAAERALRLESEAKESKRQNQRIIKRIKNGVCPCCTRTFQNLARHMASEHSDFGAEKSVRALREAYGLSQSALARQIGVNAAYVSSFENERYVPTHAKQTIEAWLTKESA